MKTQEIVTVKCICGRKLQYGNGGLRKFRKNGEIPCYECEMAKYSKILIEKNLDNGEKM